MLNRIVLIGRLTRDPELKYTPQGIPVAQLSIAVNRFSKDENGQKETDFFDIVAWRRSAEFASQYLTKGNMISVDGRLQTRSWVAQDGTKRKSYEIVAENINGLDRKGEGEALSADGGSEPAMEAPRPTAAPATRPTAAPVAAAASGGGRKPAPPPADDDLDESDPFADE